jgi:intein-encoded DNA endonuclease-like protein
MKYTVNTTINTAKPCSKIRPKVTHFVFFPNSSLQHKKIVLNLMLDVKKSPRIAVSFKFEAETSRTYI